MTTDQPNDPATAEGMANVAGERAKCCVDASVNALNAVTGKARQLGQNTDDYVRDNPWLMIGVAAGVGILIGFLLRGRRGA